MDESEKRSKFNVGSDVTNRTCNNVVFDSKMEMMYFRDVILPLERSGEITLYELQKPYELQPKFRHNGKVVQPIVYVADFYIEYADGRKEIVDTKGFADSVAKIKRKMMWYTYPDIQYTWITYVKKYGGWVEFDEVNRLRRMAKKNKEQKDISEGE